MKPKITPPTIDEYIDLYGMYTSINNILKHAVGVLNTTATDLDAHDECVDRDIARRVRNQVRWINKSSPDREHRIWPHRQKVEELQRLRRMEE